MKRIIIFSLMIISVIFLIIGCSEQTKYVCPKGEVVNYPSECPKFCGDNSCVLFDGENEVSCPSDCDISARGGQIPHCVDGWKFDEYGGNCVKVDSSNSPPR